MTPIVNAVGRVKETRRVATAPCPGARVIRIKTSLRFQSLALYAPVVPRFSHVRSASGPRR